MKRILFSTTLLSLVALIGITACSKDDVEDAVASVTGTMSAKIDGNDWSSSGPAAVFSNGAIAATGLASGDQSIVVSSSAIATGTYSFNPLTPPIGGGLYRLKINDSTTHEYVAYNGSFIITEIKTADKRMSGTFSFDAVHVPTLDTVSVTAGEMTNINYTEQ